MRRRLWLLALIAAPFATGPGTASADTCSRSTSGPPVSVSRALLATVTDTADRERTAVVVCERRVGRERRIWRAALDKVRGRGRRIGGVAVAGYTVAWIDTTATAHGTSTQVRTRDIRERRVDTRVVARTSIAAAPVASLATLGVALVVDGSIAWMAPDATGTPTIRLARPGQPSRVVTRGASLAWLGIEDGRTLRWFGPVRGHSYVDLRPLPSRDGCPVREKFKRVLTTTDVVVSRASYDSHELFAGITEIRACLRATGRDPAIAATFGLDDDSYIPGGTGDWVVVVSPALDDRSAECEASLIQTVNLRDGRKGRVGGYDICRQGPPEDGAQVAVTADGIPAWLGSGSEAGVLRALNRQTTIIELDRASAGAITDLRSTADGFSWMRDGQPHSMAVA